MSVDQKVVEEVLPVVEEPKFSKLLLAFMPVELRARLDRNAENLDMATSRFAVAVLEGLTDDQMNSALLESRKMRMGTGKKIFRDQERSRASS